MFFKKIRTNYSFNFQFLETDMGVDLFNNKWKSIRFEENQLYITMYFSFLNNHFSAIVHLVKIPVTSITQSKTKGLGTICKVL